MRPTLSLRHFLLALAVVAVWGTNFVVIKIALGHLPPLLFAALRFTAALVPAMFFLPRPKVRVGNLAAYGLFILETAVPPPKFPAAQALTRACEDLAHSPDG